MARCISFTFCSQLKLAEGDKASLLSLISGLEGKVASLQAAAAASAQQKPPASPVKSGNPFAAFAAPATGGNPFDIPDPQEVRMLDFT